MRSIVGNYLAFRDKKQLDIQPPTTPEAYELRLAMLRWLARIVEASTTTPPIHEPVGHGTIAVACGCGMAVRDWMLSETTTAETRSEVLALDRAIAGGQFAWNIPEGE